MKQQKQNRNNTEAKIHEETNSSSKNSKATEHPKNVQEASWTRFIEETMKTLATCGKQLKTHLDIHLIQTEM